MVETNPSHILHTLLLNSQIIISAIITMIWCLSMCLYLVQSRKSIRSIYLKIHTKLAYTIYQEIAYVYFRSDFVLRFHMSKYDVITTQSLKSR